ncbi:hypothetical protein JRQ81_016887 [Phrynocephalus forsythii]|uniref:Uncharacterized protein n=1 Tax=Phrynocephalus forsythii TaxID=171643 RepID=A0A9Q1B1C1_9SAUR|nr:hypothetical protein JRQ81_016887 [Phrynocephalus forsythii]
MGVKHSLALKPYLLTQAKETVKTVQPTLVHETYVGKYKTNFNVVLSDGLFDKVMGSKVITDQALYYRMLKQDVVVSALKQVCCGQDGSYKILYMGWNKPEWMNNVRWALQGRAERPSQPVPRRLDRGGANGEGAEVPTRARRRRAAARSSRPLARPLEPQRLRAFRNLVRTLGKPPPPPLHKRALISQVSHGERTRGKGGGGGTTLQGSPPPALRVRGLGRALAKRPGIPESPAHERKEEATPRPHLAARLAPANAGEIGKNLSEGEEV